MARSKNTQPQHKAGQQRTLAAGNQVWAYLRHSPGDKQTIDSQRSAVREWCATMGWTIVDTFIDEGEKGSKEEREHFQKMMAQAKQTPRPVDGIVVWSFSRFARDLQDSQFYKAWLRKLGYVVVSKSDDIPDGPIAPFIELMVDWSNERFLETLSIDVKRGLLYVVEQGFWPTSTPPIGYRLEQEEMKLRHSGGMRYGRRLVKDEAVADRVALAWRMKLQTNASYTDIQAATRLFKNIRTYGEFFDNWLYAGVFVYDGKRYPSAWEQGVRFCEAYVTLEEFQRVQQHRQARRIGMIAPRSLSSAYLLSGLLHCAYCDAQGLPSSMSGGKAQYNPDVRFYRCVARTGGRSHECPAGHIACWKIDDVVLDTLREQVLTPAYVRAEVERANAKLSTRGADMRVGLHQAEQFVREQERRVLSLVKLIEVKGLTPLLEGQYDEANSAYLNATTQLAALRSQSVQSQVKLIAYADVEQSLSELVNVLDTGTLKQKQELVRRFVERVDVHQESVHVKLRFRLEDIVKLPAAEIATPKQSYGQYIGACAAGCLIEAGTERHIGLSYVGQFRRTDIANGHVFWYSIHCPSRDDSSH